MSPRTPRRRRSLLPSPSHNVVVLPGHVVGVRLARDVDKRDLGHKRIQRLEVAGQRHGLAAFSLHAQRAFGRIRGRGVVGQDLVEEGLEEGGGGAIDRSRATTSSSTAIEQLGRRVELVLAQARTPNAAMAFRVVVLCVTHTVFFCGCHEGGGGGGGDDGGGDDGGFSKSVGSLTLVRLITGA